jgi:bifunctional non-homologous end joining protein LigD
VSPLGVAGTAIPRATPPQRKLHESSKSGIESKISVSPTTPTRKATSGTRKISSRAQPASAALNHLQGAVLAAMPTSIRPMLATATSQAFDNPDWLFEIKWDGYRAVAFIDKGTLRLVSRNQNELSGQYPELRNLSEYVKAERAVLDGEVVALDDQGRPSFSLMQQKTGFRAHGRHAPGSTGIPIMYFVFDFISAHGYDLRRVNLEERKQVLAALITPSDVVRFSDHYLQHGKALLEAARERGLEGIIAKRRNSCYEERRSSEWLKIKITRRLECVIAGYTEPEGSRNYFGSLVLGLYNKQNQLTHVGQAGSGFDQKGLSDMWTRLKRLETKDNPFFGPVDAGRRAHWVKPEMVAEIKFTEWTHETDDGGLKLRAPVFMGLRRDKAPEDCRLDQALAE